MATMAILNRFAHPSAPPAQAYRPSQSKQRATARRKQLSQTHSTSELAVSGPTAGELIGFWLLLESLIP